MNSLSLKSNDLDARSAPHLTELLSQSCILETLDLRYQGLCFRAYCCVLVFVLM